MLACYILGGSKKNIYTEDIAFKSNELNHIKFGWSLDKYKKYPDKEKTRRPLFMAREEGLVTGAYAADLSRDGWKLTGRGIKKSQELEYLLNIKYKKSNPQPADKKELSIVKRNKYFKEYMSTSRLSDNFDMYNLADLLQVSSSNQVNIRIKFFNLRNIAQMVDETIFKFLEEIRSSFQDVLDEKKLVEQQKAKKRSSISLKKTRVKF